MNHSEISEHMKRCAITDLSRWTPAVSPVVLVDERVPVSVYMFKHGDSGEIVLEGVVDVPVYTLQCPTLTIGVTTSGYLCPSNQQIVPYGGYWWELRLDPGVDHKRHYGLDTNGYYIALPSFMRSRAMEVKMPVGVKHKLIEKLKEIPGGEEFLKYFETP